MICSSYREHYKQIKEDLTKLIKLQLQIESVTTDGYKSILKAIKKIDARHRGSTMIDPYPKNEPALADKLSKAIGGGRITADGINVVAKKQPITVFSEVRI